MRKEQELIVVIRQTVTTMGDRHCSNDCIHIGTHLDRDIWIGNCALFERPLSWDKACKHHGYLRCGECLNQARVKSLSSKVTP